VSFCPISVALFPKLPSSINYSVKILNGNFQK
jgi:hypothetical protein